MEMELFMLEKLESVVKAACLKHGVGLYDLELINTQHGKVLCVYITKVNGVNITDCTKVNKEISMFLDAEETLIDGAFTLEVSSPGIERPLKFKKHYISAINELIKITYSENTQKSTIQGILKEVNPEHILIEQNDEILNIKFHDIKKAKTCFQNLKKENK
jgi:ribosome maturation factor RimP